MFAKSYLKSSILPLVMCALIIHDKGNIWKTQLPCLVDEIFLKPINKWLKEINRKANTLSSFIKQPT